MNNKIVRTISFFLIVLLLLSGCVSPSGPTEPGQATEPGKPSSDSSSHPGKDDSKSVIRMLADQQSEWTEGQYYPGAYGKTSSTFRFPAESSTYVFEANGIVYAYGDPFNAENTGRMHVIRKTDGAKEEDISLTEIPDEYRLYQMVGASDTIYLLAHQSESGADIQSLELFIYSSTGEFRARKKLLELLNSEGTANTAVGAFADQNGKLWIYEVEARNYTCIEPDGQVSLKISLPEEVEGGLMRGREADELTVALKTENGLTLGKLNTKTGTAETQTIEGLPGVKTILPGTMYDALVVTENSLYGVTLDETIAVKELLAFTDLGVDQSILRSAEDHEDGSISMLLFARGKTEGERIVLTPSLTKVRNGLTLACLKSNDYLVYAVGQYNQEHPDDKITIKQYYDKYAVDASETDALNRLNSDLMDGTAGDIVCLDGISFAGGGKALLDKGVFVDLYELMDQDPEFHKEDYFTDVWRANETDGKLYRLVPFFTLNTSFGRVDEVGVTTHLDELILFETDPVTTLFGPMYRRRDFIHDLLVFSLGDVTDPNAALYDTSKLASYIEVAGRMPEFEKYNNDNDGTETEAYNHAQSQEISDLGNHITHYFKQLLSDTSNNLNFYGCRWASAWLGETMPDYFPEGVKTEEEIIGYLGQIGIRVTFSGFPVKEGCGSALINRLSLAIPAGSEDPESAWIFLKSTLSGEYQSRRKLTNDSIPVSKEVFYTFTEKLINDPDKTIDGELYRGYSGPNLLGDEPFFWWTPVLQQWMVDEFVDLLSDITLIDEVDPNVEAIVTEEIGKYCDGRQTAEEAARNIAERVELYRDEQ